MTGRRQHPSWNGKKPVQEEVRSGLKAARNVLAEQLESSLHHLENRPELEGEMVRLWTSEMRKTLREATVISEKHGNHRLMKALTRNLIFNH